MTVALSEVFNMLCQPCAVSPTHITDVELNCSASGLVYVSAVLVYSSADGGVTASTLITMLLTWLLSEDQPSLVVSGVSASLSKQCAPQLNTITRNGCLQLFTATPSTQSTESMQSTAPNSNISGVLGSFFAGLAGGVLITDHFHPPLHLVRLDYCQRSMHDTCWSCKLNNNNNVFAV